MKKFLKPAVLMMAAAICLCACGESIDLTNAVTVTADFSKIVDPPLLKKVAMYNAGCIQPLSNYERDFSRITELNADALRIDLSIGKDVGTGGQYLVTDEYGYDDATGTIDPNSLHYDFSQLDSIVKYMTDYGVLPYMSWDYIPYPLQEDGKWNNLDTDVANWQEVWEEIYYQYAKHYLELGIKIGYHEIYNEPDLEILKCWGVFDPDNFDGFLNWYDFCKGALCAPGDGVYPDMYEYGAKGIARAYEEMGMEATIGGPAFALGEIGVEDWVGFLPRVKSQNLPLDFYSFHTYLDGDTWFRSDEVRAESGGNEIEKVVQGLGGDSYFLKTAVHINEFSYLNDANGANEGLNSPYNYFGGAWRTIDGLMEAVNRTTVQWVYWAQFMESTGGYDPYGMIEKDGGNVKAPFNAMKIYMDMPVWRYEAATSRDDGLQALVSSDGDKIGILLWNTNSADEANGDRVANVLLSNPTFDKGTRRVYRIDADHASYFDNNENAELVAENVKTVKTNESVWAGTVPADGMVYITINKDSKAEDFSTWANRTTFADDVKTQYYYEDRFRGLEGCRELYEDNLKGLNGSYSHFDRTNWTMYLGMGDCTGLDGRYVGQGHANGAVIVTDLPKQFKVSLKTEGNINMRDVNTTLGFRVDFADASGNYVKSVYFYSNDLYDANRNPNAQDSRLKKLDFYPWGTTQKPDVAISCKGSEWSIDLSQYAPAGWNGKAQISFDMQNTGAGTRAMFTLSK